MYKKDNNKGKHLTLEERMTILNELVKGTKLSDISNKIGKDPTTISKEVKLHRYSELMDERKNDFDFTSIGLAIKRARITQGMTREHLARIVDYARDIYRQFKTSGKS